jgi:hypothetical protein
MAAAGDDQAELRLVVAKLLQQRGDLPLERLAFDLEVDGSARPLQAVKVLGEGERATRVEANHLEDAVTPLQPVVRGRDGRIRRLHDLPIDAGQLRRGHAWRGYRSAVAVARTRTGARKAQDR